MSTVSISEEEFYRLKEAAGEGVKPRDFSQCIANGHTWKFYGGCNAGCDRDCGCSVDVHQCIICGDFDYGDTPEAEDVRQKCAEHGDHSGWEYV
ncbi:hypothetical protein [Phyllobacterium chamaecytisi]|uniref:hypothetical protein n=1 Tax=Phyllobacterium chamaecytisi TaxID=2876082 RepID=UPI001CC957FF|nr:hypothetical protein [Phyllobacterium sp. KW56]MBZ9600682.1 hypothetical protein [Phyllobacterium sp. KW56]